MAEPMATEGASPQKKRGPPEDEKLSLEAIREVVRGEIWGSNAALKAELSHRMDSGARGHGPAGEDPGKAGVYQQPAKRPATSGRDDPGGAIRHDYPSADARAKSASDAIRKGFQHSRH